MQRNLIISDFGSGGTLHWPRNTTGIIRNSPFGYFTFCFFNHRFTQINTETQKAQENSFPISVIPNQQKGGNKPAYAKGFGEV
jgi:hypothetical protein